MKTRFKTIAFGLLVCLMLNGCATILGGRITTSQRTKPKRGQAQRQVRVGFLIADIICLVVPLAVDFGTGAIYKPSSGKSK